MTTESNPEAIAAQVDQFVKFYLQPPLRAWQQIQLTSEQLTGEQLLVAQARQLFKQGFGFYKQRDFQAALTAWQQTIELHEQLPLDNPQYRHDLAMVYAICGNLLYDLRRFEAAIDYYQQAIEFGKHLPRGNLEYLHSLASYYNNCGNALRGLRRFEATIDYFQQAIELRKHLPLDNPQYRNELAGAYYNFGCTLRALKRFEAAIDCYQQAIELGKQLPLDNPEYRHALANSYSNCGNALGDLGCFWAAEIDYHQQAIKLGKHLPLNNPQYLSDSVRYNNYYGALLNSLGQFEMAIDYFQQAIELGKQLPLDNPEYRTDLARAYTNCARAFFGLGRFAEAEDAIEESLTILQQLEQQGIYWFREEREHAFEIAIEIYLNNDVFNFWPELILILEHLDPVNAGAAPQSERMHRAALNGLLRLYQQVYHTHPKLLPEIQETIGRLAVIRAKYFTGTATGTKLTAQFHEENMQDLVKAKNILEHYTQQVADDPEGYIQLADFYVRRQDVDIALNTYQAALQRI